MLNTNKEGKRGKERNGFEEKKENKWDVFKF